jgi:hypothetical protein
VARQQPVFEPERLALEYAERMTITGQSVDDALFDRIKKHYSEAQIGELTAAVALEDFRSKFTRRSASRRRVFALCRGASRIGRQHAAVEAVGEAAGVGGHEKTDAQPDFAGRIARIGEVRRIDARVGQPAAHVVHRVEELVARYRNLDEPHGAAAFVANLAATILGPPGLTPD